MNILFQLLLFLSFFAPLAHSLSLQESVESLPLPSLSPQLSATLPAVSTWGVISLNTLEDINPRVNPVYNPSAPLEGPWRGTSGFRMIIEGWCGAALARSADEDYIFFLHCSGGSNDYQGSGLYGFSLRSGTFRMFSAPYTGTSPAGNDGRYPDGSCLSGQSSDVLVYYPPTDVFVALQTKRGDSSGVSFRPCSFGPITEAIPISLSPAPINASHLWVQMEENVAAGVVSWGTHPASCYDASRRRVWMHGAGSTETTLSMFEPASRLVSGSSVHYDGSGHTSGDLMAECSPTLDLMLLMGDNSAFFAKRLSDPDAAPVDLSLTADSLQHEAVISGTSGIAYSRLRDSFLLFNGDVKGAVYELKPSNAVDWTAPWSLTLLSIPTEQLSVRPVAPENGVRGKFHTALFAGGVELAITVTDVDSPMYAFRVPPISTPPISSTTGVSSTSEGPVAPSVTPSPSGFPVPVLVVIIILVLLLIGCGCFLMYFLGFRRAATQADQRIKLAKRSFDLDEGEEHLQIFDTLSTVAPAPSAAQPRSRSRSRHGSRSAGGKKVSNDPGYGHLPNRRQNVSNQSLFPTGSTPLRAPPNATESPTEIYAQLNAGTVASNAYGNVASNAYGNVNVAGAASSPGAAYDVVSPTGEEQGYGQFVPPDQEGDPGYTDVKLRPATIDDIYSPMYGTDMTGVSGAYANNAGSVFGTNSDDRVSIASTVLARPATATDDDQGASKNRRRRKSLSKK